MVIINASMFCELTENIMIEATSQTEPYIKWINQAASEQDTMRRLGLPTAAMLSYVLALLRL
jgi:hypothetical protein